MIEYMNTLTNRGLPPMSFIVQNLAEIDERLHVSMVRVVVVRGCLGPVRPVDNGPTIDSTIEIAT